MRQSKFTETQIVSILKEADAGRPVSEIWRKYCISSATEGFTGVVARSSCAAERPSSRRSRVRRHVLSTWSHQSIQQIRQAVGVGVILHRIGDIIEQRAGFGIEPAQLLFQIPRH